jgi:hypothetical protein
MAEPTSKVPVQFEKSPSRLPQQWEPFERFRREMDHLFDDFTGGLLGRSFVRSHAVPAYRSAVSHNAQPSRTRTEHR